MCHPFATAEHDQFWKVSTRSKFLSVHLNVQDMLFTGHAQRHEAGQKWPTLALLHITYACHAWQQGDSSVL